MLLKGFRGTRTWVRHVHGLAPVPTRGFTTQGSLYDRPAVASPTLERLEELSKRFGFELAKEELVQYKTLIDGSLKAWTDANRMSEPLPQPLRPRWPRTPGGRRPTPEENPHRAWYWKTEIVGASEGPLKGKRVAIKDNVAVAGVPMMNGSAVLESYIPEFDATVINRILDAGGIIAGKAACEDLCLSGSSFTTHLGPINNPAAPGHSAGGSSGGSAALVAAGEVDLAIAGDQGGSIRIPSSFCGTVGHKPTFGLVPYTGACPIEMTIDHLGPVAKTVKEVAQFLEVIAGSDGLDPRQRIPSKDVSPLRPRRGDGGLSATPFDFTGRLDGDLKGLRIGVLKQGFGIPGVSSPETDKEVLASVQRLVKAGAQVVDVNEPVHCDSLAIWNLVGIEGLLECLYRGNSMATNLPGASGYGRGYFAPTSMIDAFAGGFARRSQELAPTVKYIFLLAEHIRTSTNGRFYAKGANLRTDITRAYDRHLRGSEDSSSTPCDVLIMPTTPYPAPQLPTSSPSVIEFVSEALGMIANTAPFNITGHPALSIDCRSNPSSQRPIGMMIVGRHWEDETVLRVAYAHEQLLKAKP